jgi:hypothetical protein
MRTARRGDGSQGGARRGRKAAGRVAGSEADDAAELQDSVARTPMKGEGRAGVLEEAERIVQERRTDDPVPPAVPRDVNAELQANPRRRERVAAHAKAHGFRRTAVAESGDAKRACARFGGNSARAKRRILVGMLTRCARLASRTHLDASASRTGSAPVGSSMRRSRTSSMRWGGRAHPQRDPPFCLADLRGTRQNFDV